MGAQLKKRETRRCAMASLVLRPIKRPVAIRIAWVERDLRRDIDNIAAGGTKVILDGMVSAGVLPNDSRKWVTSLTHTFPVPDKDNPRVEVTVEEL